MRGVLGWYLAFRLEMSKGHEYDEAGVGGEVMGIFEIVYQATCFERLLLGLGGLCYDELVGAICPFSL